MTQHSFVRLFQSRFTRAISLVLFALFVLLLMENSVMAAVSPERQYERAKQEMNALRKDAKRSQWREPWLQLAEKFEKLYSKNAQWKNRSMALFRSAVALDELASRSYAGVDTKEAVERYKQVADQHPQSPLADDALYSAAKLSLAMKDSTTALALLHEQLKRFPSGDMAKDGQNLANTIRQQPGDPSSDASSSNSDAENATSSAKKGTSATRSLPAASAARLSQVGWQSRNNSATITFECDRPVQYVVRSQLADSKSGRPARLVVELVGVTPGPQVKPGARVTGSLLNRVRVDVASPGATRVYLDFTKLKRFSVSTLSSPFRLVVVAAATDGVLPAGKRVGETVQSKTLSDKSGVQVPSDIAAQLGLSMGMVVIDPGHGGGDPGTDHNGILERVVALDMAKRVGKLLEKYGVRVRYTRSKDERVTLESRSRLANEAKGDLMVSLHVNANENESINGFETYFLDFASSSSAARLASVENSLSDRKLGDLEGLLADLMLGARTQESRRIAESIQKSTMGTVKKRNYTVRDGGVRAAPFHILLGSSMPGVLVEIGYCTNKAEAKKLAQPAYRDALAEGIVNGILHYSKKLDDAGKK